MKYLALKVAKLDFRAVRAVNSYGHRAPTNGTLSVNNLFCSSGKTGDPSLHSLMNERMPILVQKKGIVHVELVLSLGNVKKLVA